MPREIAAQLFKTNRQQTLITKQPQQPQQPLKITQNLVDQNCDACIFLSLICEVPVTASDHRLIISKSINPSSGSLLLSVMGKMLISSYIHWMNC